MNETVLDAFTVSCQGEQQSSEIQTEDVGHSAQGLSIRELQAHAASCHYLMQLAKARYRGSKSLADAQEAGRWMVLKEQAQSAVLAARRAQARADELTMAGEWARRLA